MKAADYYSDACLVITRSGRNTLSELTYLGIPTISFISGCAYRQVEQKQNMDNIDSDGVISSDLSVNPTEFALKCRFAIETKYASSHFEPGNEVAINRVLNILNS